MRCSLPGLSLYAEIAWGPGDPNIESPTIIDRRLPEREMQMGSRVLTFVGSDTWVSDEETGMYWSCHGVALTGPTDGEVPGRDPRDTFVWVRMVGALRRDGAVRIARMLRNHSWLT